jgi:hypothetical protein
VHFIAASVDAALRRHKSLLSSRKSEPLADTSNVSVAGIAPVNLLLTSSKIPSLDSAPISEGIVPVSLFPFSLLFN